MFFFQLGGMKYDLQNAVRLFVTYQHSEKNPNEQYLINPEKLILKIDDNVYFLFSSLPFNQHMVQLIYLYLQLTPQHVFVKIYTLYDSMCKSLNSVNFHL
jgi:hypothetical protein